VKPIPIEERNLIEIADELESLIPWRVRERLRAIHEQHEAFVDKVVSQNDALCMELRDLKDLTRWIPVSERMPTDIGYYRIWDITEAQALFKDGEWIGERCIPSDSPYLKSKFREKLSPTHWQLLSTPPEGKI